MIPAQPEDCPEVGFVLSIVPRSKRARRMTMPHRKTHRRNGRGAEKWLDMIPFDRHYHSSQEALVSSKESFGS